MGPIYEKLKSPAYDLAVFEPPGMGEAGLVLIPGGGGSAKSGISNVIEMGTTTSRGTLDLIASHTLGDELCNSIAGVM